ncbi:MAG: M81 family metallopeptidase [Burkholderiales bacterium]
MRVVIARMEHETNTFSPMPTPLVAFGAGNGVGPAFGADALAEMTGARVTMGGMLAVAKARGCEVVTPLAAMAYPSGPVHADAYERMVEAILAAIAAGCDAILLDLHGAMVACPNRYGSGADGEGDLLAAIRRIAPRTPLALGLDLHGNLSHRMVQLADIVVGYKTYPHIDMFETGEHTARLLFDMLDGRIRPVMGYAHARVLAQTLMMNTNLGAMREALQGAHWREKDAGILACSVFGGFPQADTDDAGMCMVVVADAMRPGAPALAQSTARWGADFLNSRRAEFIFAETPLNDSIAAARRAAQTGAGRPVILLDHGDNCMSGGTCDTMDVPRAALAAGLDGIVVGPTRDPQAVEAMLKAGVGARVSLDVGGKTPMPAIGIEEPRPLRLSGTVRAISSGDYVVSGPIFTGQTLHMGRSAVLDTGRMKIVVSSELHEPLDLGCFASVGIDPAEAAFLVLKSRMYFRPVFEPLAAAVIPCASAGVTSSDNALFRFSRVRRPIYPLDRG